MGKDIIQTFYDNLATQYDKLFFDWQETTKEQAIGLAALGYDVTASDISPEELREAKVRAAVSEVSIRFEHADFCALQEVFSEEFDIVIAMDNALPHMLSKEVLDSAVKSIVEKVTPGGIFVASIRDYDELLKSKPPYSPPYIHKLENGKGCHFKRGNGMMKTIN